MGKIHHSVPPAGKRGGGERQQRPGGHVAFNAAGKRRGELGPAAAADNAHHQGIPSQADRRDRQLHDARERDQTPRTPHVWTSSRRKLF